MYMSVKFKFTIKSRVTDPPPSKKIKNNTKVTKSPNVKDQLYVVSVNAYNYVNIHMHLHKIKATSTFIVRYNALIQTLQRSPNHE